MISSDRTGDFQKSGRAVSFSQNIHAGFAVLPHENIQQTKWIALYVPKPGNF
jgi:hypothetical protein